MRDVRLELEWQTTKASGQQLFATEEARRGQVRICVLECERGYLEQQIAHDAYAIMHLESRSGKLHSGLGNARRALQILRRHLRTRTSDINKLKAELMDARQASVASQHVLSEKSTLTEELSRLRPEIELLRSQQASFEEAVSENRALQRQLSTIEIELETQRRSAQSANTSKALHSQQEAQYQSQLATLLQTAAKETQSRHDVEKRAHELETQLANQNHILESKLHDLKNKLSRAKNDLKLARVQLRQAQGSGMAAFGEATAQHRSNKRSGDDASNIFEQNSPRGVLATKVNRGVSARPGDKSSFSVDVWVPGTDSGVPDVSDFTPANANAQEQSEETVHDAVTEKTSSQATVVPDARGLNDRHQISEERNIDMEGIALAGTQQARLNILKQKKSISDGRDNEDRRKRVKIIGGGSARNIFDEDEGEFVAGHEGNAVLNLNGASKIKSIRFPAGQKTRSELSGQTGGFSPLKRDRRQLVT